VVEQQRWRVDARRDALRHLSPLADIATMRRRLNDLDERSSGQMRHTLALRRERLRGAALALAGLSPQATLDRGYAIVRHIDRDAIVLDAAQVAPGDRLQVQVRRGRFETIVAD
jgi:exodeoxyribonuclease VII large subunit